MVPKNEKGFEISPKIYELSKMTENQLSKVSNFTVSNEQGKIEFINPVDLRNVNLGEDIDIKQKKISVY